MKIIQNKFSDLILFRGFIALTLWPFLFVRTGKTLSPTIFNHECIHACQQKETMLVTSCVIGILTFVGIPVSWCFSLLAILLNWYLWYGIAWSIQLIFPPWRSAYHDICFEVEAQVNQKNPDYLKTRRPLAWVQYIFSNLRDDNTFK